MVTWKMQIGTLWVTHTELNHQMLFVSVITHFLFNTGGYDLYIPGDGRWEIETKAIDCPTVPGKNGNIMFRFTGSNPSYVKLQARNTK